MESFKSTESPAVEAPASAPAPAPAPAPASSSSHVRAVIAELAPLMARQRHQWAWLCHEHGLSITHLQVITALEAEGALPMSRLAELLDVGLSNATGIIGRMEERGIVERTHDVGDRRVVLAQLTQRGRALISEIEAGRILYLSQLLETMSPDEQANLLAAVRNVVAAIERTSTSHIQRSTHS